MSEPGLLWSEQGLVKVEVEVEAEAEESNLLG